MTRLLIQKSTHLSDKQKDSALQELSLHPEDSALYAIIHPNIHLSFACDILHMLDVGLSKDIWTLVIRWIGGKDIRPTTFTDEEKIDKWTEDIAKIKAALLVKAEKIAKAEAKASSRRAAGKTTKEVKVAKVTKTSMVEPILGREGGLGFLDELDTRARGVEHHPGM